MSMAQPAVSRGGGQRLRCFASRIWRDDFKRQGCLSPQSNLVVMTTKSALPRPGVSHSCWTYDKVDLLSRPTQPCHGAAHVRSSTRRLVADRQLLVPLNSSRPRHWFQQFPWGPADSWHAFVPLISAEGRRQELRCRGRPRFAQNRADREGGRKEAQHAIFSTKGLSPNTVNFAASSRRSSRQADIRLCRVLSAGFGGNFARREIDRDVATSRFFGGGMVGLQFGGFMKTWARAQRVSTTIHGSRNIAWYYDGIPRRSFEPR